jgi:hypothetical protein
VVGFFKDYINLFLAVKQEASGWPASCTTEEQRAEYVRMYKEKEGIDLDPARIANNPGMYSVAKLYLNSLWGKWGQRLSESFEEVVFLNLDKPEDEKELIKCINDITIQHFTILDQNCVMFKRSAKKEENRDERLMNKRVTDKNITYAIFTTAQARLKLYEDCLEPLQKRVMYYDTDSVIFEAKEDENPQTLAPLGSFLGDLTNELGDKYSYGDEWIVEFMSGGPKHYAYLTNKDKECLKVKGISTSKREVQEQLTVQDVKAAVLEGHQKQITMNQIRIHKFHLFSRKTAKVYRTSFMKRKRLPTDEQGHIDSVPWCNDTVQEYRQETKRLKKK